MLQADGTQQQPSRKQQNWSNPRLHTVRATPTVSHGQLINIYVYIYIYVYKLKCAYSCSFKYMYVLYILLLLLYIYNINIYICWDWFLCEYNDDIMYMAPSVAAPSSPPRSICGRPNDPPKPLSPWPTRGGPTLCQFCVIQAC